MNTTQISLSAKYAAINDAIEVLRQYIGQADPFQIEELAQVADAHENHMRLAQQLYDEFEAIIAQAGHTPDEHVCLNHTTVEIWSEEKICGESATYCLAEWNEDHWNTTITQRGVRFPR